MFRNTPTWYSRNSEDRRTRKLSGITWKGGADGAPKPLSESVDMTSYSAILKQYGCADGAACQIELNRRIQIMDSRVSFHYLLALAATLLGFLLLRGRRSEIAVQLLFCIALLAGGIFTPMLEVEAKISESPSGFFG